MYYHKNSVLCPFPNLQNFLLKKAGEKIAKTGQGVTRVTPPNWKCSLKGIRVASPATDPLRITLPQMKQVRCIKKM